jgi:hypothetical protein
MHIEYVELKKADIDSDESFKTARAIAGKFRDFLDDEKIQSEVREKDICGALSRRCRKSSFRAPRI